MSEVGSGATGGKRQFKGVAAKVIRVVTVVFPIYLLLYASGALIYLGAFIYPIRHDALTLMFVLVLAYLLYPATKSAPRDRLPWYDAVAIVLSIAVNVYIIINCIVIVTRPYTLPTVMEQAFSVILVVLILEGVRRTTSPALAIIGLIFFIYPFVAGHMPSFLYSPSQGLPRVAEMLYVFPLGIYGRLVDIFATLVVAFYLFGAFIQASGAGEFLTTSSHALMGRFRGGPAKIAELASALFGTINGSGTANVALTGPVTIPLMIKVGYKPHFAAAVEAVASNGGQLMPPILGIAAFIMVDFLGVPYLTIMMASFIPALLYFAALFLMLDFEAAKTGLKGLPPQELPSFKKALMGGWLYSVPIIFLVVLIVVVQYSPQTSCIYALVVVVIVSWLIKGKGMGPRKIMDALSRGVEQVPQLGVVIAMVSILVGGIELTGVGVRLTGGLVTLAGGNMFLLLLFTAFAAGVLGMGMPTSGVYILVAILLAPALVMVGLQPIVAHMFVFYFGLTAMITPPVCLTAFVAASIAGAPFMKTGWQAMRLGIVIFIVPFMFAYAPELLMIGSAGQIALAAGTSLIGVVFLSAGLEGYLLKSAGWPERILFLVAGMMMMIPGLTTDILGVALGSVAVLWQFIGRRATATSTG
ncbi:TRAP transporter permease [Chloroflexota bacterium]